MELTEELVLESSGDLYPGLVIEALNAADESTKLAASLSSCGYAWIIVGKSLFVWKCDEQEPSDIQCTKLILPASGLPYIAQTICMYKRNVLWGAEVSSPSLVAVSPEGVVRHWPVLGRQYTDATVDLDGEVVLCVIRIAVSDSTDNAYFLLSTTTSSFYLLIINLSSTPAPGKRQRLSSDIIIKTVHTNVRSGVLGKLTAGLFGDGKQQGAHLLKTLVYEREDNTAGERSSERNEMGFREKNLHVLAVNDRYIHSYSIGNGAKMWTYDLANLANECFSSHVWNLNIRLQSHLIHDMKTWLIDAINIRDGILVLCACSNKTVSRQVHLALAYLADYDDHYVPTEISWFYVLKEMSDEFGAVDDSALASLSLKLPAISIHRLHDKIEGVLLISNTSVYSIRLPDSLARNAVLKSFHSFKYEDVLFGSGCDARYCYLFLKKKGLSRVRLLPKGFISSLMDNLSAMSFREIVGMSFRGNADDRQKLGKAFNSFSAGDMVRSSELVNELTSARNEDVVAELCANYALLLIDGIPNDERWWSVANVSLHDRSNDSRQSLLLEVHLKEQKKKVLTMFVLFLRYMSLDRCLGHTVTTKHTDRRCARSQIDEFFMKIDLAIALYAWIKDHPKRYFERAISNVLRKRDENCDSELLKPTDFFFRKVSAIDEFFFELVNAEKDLIANEEILDENLNCVNFIGSTLLIAVNVIDKHQSSSSDSRQEWIEERRFHDPFIEHIDILFDTLYMVERGCSKYMELLKQAVVIGGFVLDKQPSKSRQSSPIIAKFLEAGEVDAAFQLSRQFKDYETVVKITCSLPDAERKAKIREYMDCFNSAEFSKVVYDYYLRNGLLSELIEEKGPFVTQFFNSHANIRWIREIEQCEFTKASLSLKSLAERCDDDVVKRKRLLSFAKLAALCADENDKELLEDITMELQLIKHQEKISRDIKQPLGSKERPPVVRPLSAEEIIQANLDNAGHSITNYFNALLTLSTLLNEKNIKDDRKDLLSSLLRKVWLSAVKIDTDFWRDLHRDDRVDATVYSALLTEITSNGELTCARKLELMPKAEILLDILVELNRNKFFGITLRSLEEAARRAISRCDEAILAVSPVGEIESTKED